MSEKIKCSRCKYRLPKLVCGCPESKYYNQKIEHTMSCEYFINNPAQGLFSEALVKSAILDSPEQNEQLAREVIGKFEEALRLGLPQDDEMIARFSLGQICLRFAWPKQPGSRPSNQEVMRAIKEMEASVIIDSQGGYGYFLNRINSARLQTLAAAYGAISQRIQEEQGTDSAIAYVQQKLELFNYLPGPPSLLLLNLGELYESKGQTANARTIFMKVLERAENPVDDIDSDVRKSIENRIQETKSQEKKKSGCFIATAVYGNENAPEVENLRRFRDQLLVRSCVGRAFIIFYYLVSPTIARLIEPSEPIKSLIRTIVLRPALWLSQELTRNKQKKSRPHNLEQLY